MALADTPLDLIESARKGDQTAIETLMRQSSPDLYRIIYSQLRDHDETDEVLQETLLRAFRYIHKLKDLDRFAPWLIRIAVNQVHTFRMKKGRTRLYELAEGMEPEESAVVLNGSGSVNPREEVTRQELRQHIVSAMKKLPNRQQTAIMLFELEGLSIKEIASAMECSEGAVKFNIHEARKKLQKMLRPLLRSEQITLTPAASARG